MNPELESILRRINKLLAIASDTRANSNAALAAAAMAEKIMREHQIEHADLILTKVKDDLITETAVASAKTNGTRVKEVPLWASWMAVAVARLNDCGARKYLAASGDMGIQYCGYSADVKVAVYMFTYLVNTVLAATATYRKEYDLGRKATNSFRKGIASSITMRLEAMAITKKTEMWASSSGTALMVVKKDSIEEKYGTSIFPVAQSKTSTSDVGAFTRGVRKGHSIDIDRKSETTNVLR
jgi:hypothetical protein